MNVQIAVGKRKAFRNNIMTSICKETSNDQMYLAILLKFDFPFFHKMLKFQLLNEI